MGELIFLVGLILGLIVLAMVFKVAFAIVIWPLKALCWLTAGLFKLILLPFQFVGGIIMAVLFLPILILGLCALVGFGVPLAIIAVVGLAVWMVCGLLSLFASMLFGWG